MKSGEIDIVSTSAQRLKVEIPTLNPCRIHLSSASLSGHPTG